MNIIFFGNTKYSLIGAQIIHEQIGISHIVTIPDRPDKRGRLQESPLKTFGKGNNIPILEVNKITEETIEEIKKLEPDFFVVEDYGLILPAKLLEIPKSAALNIHHSLLPKYRGSSPAPTAILNGDTITGVSVIKMTEQLDAGDILGQKGYEIQPDDTTDSLLTKLNQLGGELIVPILKDFDNAKTKAIKQNEIQATYTKKLTKADGYIDLNLLEIGADEGARLLDKGGTWKLEIARKIRAYYPWPTVWTKMTINGQEKIVKLLPSSSLRGMSKTSDEAISSKILLQVEGKNPMSVKDFINGYPELKEFVTKFLED